MKSIRAHIKIVSAVFLSLGAGALVLLGIQSQDSQYSVTNNTGDIVASCFGTSVAHAVGGESDAGGGNNCDPWVGSDNGSDGENPDGFGGGGGGDGDSCGDYSGDTSDCSPW